MKMMKKENFIYNIGKFKDEKLKDKSIDFAYYLKKYITIHHFEKERSYDLYEINRDIEEIEVKSDIISILKRIDEYKYKVESDFYVDVEQKQYEKNQKEKARLRDKKIFEVFGTSDDSDDSDSDSDSDSVHSDVESKILARLDFSDSDLDDSYVYIDHYVVDDSDVVEFAESQSVSLL